MKPSRPAPSPIASAPTITESAEAYRIARSLLPAARGSTATAISGPSEESGPSTRIRDGPTSA